MGERNKDVFAPAHAALERMRRASERGTGCHLTAEMIRALSLSLIAQMWSEATPTNERNM